LGATLQSLQAPDRDGNADDIVLGYDDAATYLDNPQYFGATIGRYANRIAGGRFALDGQTHQLDVNDGVNHLHGGAQGFDKQVWEIVSVESGDTASVTMRYVSADGEGGYPGNLTAEIIYSLNDAGELTIDHRATTDAPTIVNLTNHSFFNLSGARSLRSALDQTLTLHSSAYTPVDSGLIPTGELRAVAGTPFDFTEPAEIGLRVRDYSDEQMRLGRGYDHNFVIDGEAGELRLAAVLEDPESGRVLELLTAAPGVQFYSGNFLDGTVVGKSQQAYRQGDGICLEPQVFPDSPNRADFPSSQLNPGEEYRNVMVFRLGVSAAGAGN
jgi:aldose 1-epimerase